MHTRTLGCLRMPLSQYGGGCTDQAIDVIRTHPPHVKIRVHADVFQPGFHFLAALRGPGDANVRYVTDVLGAWSCSLLSHDEMPNEYNIIIEASASDCVCENCYQRSKLAAAATHAVDWVDDVHEAYRAWSQMHGLYAPAASEVGAVMEFHL